MAENQEIINATTDKVSRYVDGRGKIIGVVVGVATVESQRNDSIVARQSALANMNEQAARMGANAVVGIRFDSVVFALPYPHDDRQNVEYTAYGTAVRLS